MTALTNTDPNVTYVALLQTGDAVGLTSSLKTIQDGLGNNSALKLSTAAMQAGNYTFTGSTIALTSGAATFTPNITFSGNVTVVGTTTLSGGITLSNPSTFGTAVLTLGGNLTTSGSSALTLTTTGSTNVTLPTSGTLVNSAVTTLSSLSSASSLATVGTITSGLWHGTAIDISTYASGTLAVANGGSGRATLTANYVLLGNGTSAVQMIAPGTSGNVLTSNGTTWSSTAPAASVSAASTAQEAAGTSTTVYTSPGTQQYHNSSVKAWASIIGGASSVNASYNVSGVVRNSTGNYSITFTVPFVDPAHMAIHITGYNASAVASFVQSYSNFTMTIQTTNLSGTAIDPTNIFVTVVGVLG